MKWVVFLATVFLIVSSLKKVIDEKARLYHNDQSIEYITDLLAIGKQFKKSRCQLDKSYPMMTIGSADAKLSAILVCNVHARQLITTQICLSFMKKLARKENNLLKNIEFRIFYRGNNVRDRVINGQYCLRVNGNGKEILILGIDMNRNFPTGFDQFQTKPGEQTYKGQHPLSETFSKCLDAEVERKKPDIYLDLHSGEFTFYHQPGVNEQNQVKIMEMLQSQLCNNCLIEKNQSPQGQIFQDMKIRRKVPYSMLFEVYGGYNDNLSHKDNCFTIFNPETKKQLDYYLKKWTTIIWKFYEEIIAIQQQ